MSNQDQTPAAEAAPAPAPAKSKLGGKTKLIIGGLVLLTTIAECVIVYLYVSSNSVAEADEPAAHAAASDHHEKPPADKHAGASKHASHHEEAAHAPKHDENKINVPAPIRAKRLPGDQREVELGEFQVSAYQPLSNTTLRLDFHIFGTVADGQEDEFASLLEAKKQRFRDQVITIIRSGDIADFTEAGLGLIKRRILETTNKTLGRPYLHSVIFSKFSFIEQ